MPKQSGGARKGAGRPPGVTNKVTYKDIMKMVGKKGAEAPAKLWMKLILDEDKPDAIRLKASELLAKHIYVSADKSADTELAAITREEKLDSIREALALLRAKK